jgi:hypothetical protein
MALQDLTPQLRTRMSRVERLVGLFVAFEAERAHRDTGAKGADLRLAGVRGRKLGPAQACDRQPGSVPMLFQHLPNLGLVAGGTVAGEQWQQMAAVKHRVRGETTATAQLSRLGRHPWRYGSRRGSWRLHRQS